LLMRIPAVFLTGLLLMGLAGALGAARDALADGSPPTELTPVYPENFACGPITSLFGSMTDLDHSRRSEPHVGIDLGNRGDVVIAPADGVIRAIWRVEHGWGDDWNVLLLHAPADLNLPGQAVVYFTEFDHLRRDDIAHLTVGARVRRGDRIGVVRHPGNNAQFRAEVHLEVYEVPANRQDEMTWHTDGGFRYWVNHAARLIDPLSLLAQHQREIVDGHVEIVPYHATGDYRAFRGFIYPLSCPNE